MSRVLELSEIESWEALGDGEGGTWLASVDFHLSASVIPASCFFSSGNTALSFVNKISGLIAALQPTGRRFHLHWKAGAAPVAGGAHREPALPQDPKPVSQT